MKIDNECCCGCNAQKIEQTKDNCPACSQCRQLKEI